MTRLELGTQNITQDLKKAFPGCDFTVIPTILDSQKSFIGVYWMPGPSLKAVDKVVAKYALGVWNDKTEVYDYSPEAIAFGDERGGATFIWTKTI